MFPSFVLGLDCLQLGTASGGLGSAFWTKLSTVRDNYTPMRGLTASLSSHRDCKISFRQAGTDVWRPLPPLVVECLLVLQLTLAPET